MKINFKLVVHLPLIQSKPSFYFILKQLFFYFKINNIILVNQKIFDIIISQFNLNK